MDETKEHGELGTKRMERDMLPIVCETVGGFRISAPGENLRVWFLRSDHQCCIALLHLTAWK